MKTSPDRQAEMEERNVKNYINSLVKLYIDSLVKLEFCLENQYFLKTGHAFTGYSIQMDSYDDVPTSPLMPSILLEMAIYLYENDYSIIATLVVDKHGARDAFSGLKLDRSVLEKIEKIDMEHKKVSSLSCSNKYAIYFEHKCLKK